MIKEETCKERIDKELKGRLKDIKEALNNDEKREEYEENLLALSKRITYRVELSYGGPQDYFTIEVNPETKEIEGIIYHFLDWFDGAERVLEGEEFEAVAQMFSYLTDF